jgi:gluconate/galactonate dehydratase
MTPQDTLNNVNTNSRPSDLMITDIRFTDIVGAPMHCSLMKIYTNQGIVGMGEVRDGASKTYALMLKSRLLGQNPCNVDKIFRRIKQFGGMSRQAGGVCGVELALWDLAGKAYGVPVYQMLGGKFRDRVRVYCDTDISGKPDGKKMGEALKKRMAMGFTFLKMDLGLGELGGVPGTLNAPLGFMEQLKSHSGGHFGKRTMNGLDDYVKRSAWYDDFNIAHPFTGIQLTEKGLDILEKYVADVRSVIGYEIPLAIDHLGHIPYKDGLKLAKRIEKYNIAWMEDLVPWQMTDQYVELSRNTTIPICTGEDIYLKENFKPLLESGGVQVIHPDLLSSGGILENKKIGDMAQDYGVAMAVHMAESPVACMAAAHSVSATENFLALEFHSVDVPWWNDIVTGLPSPIIDKGFITVSDKPGLGIDDYNDEVLAEHIHPLIPGMWEPTTEWDGEWSHDRTWS